MLDRCNGRTTNYCRCKNRGNKTWRMDYVDRKLVTYCRTHEQKYARVHEKMFKKYDVLYNAGLPYELVDLVVGYLKVKNQTVHTMCTDNCDISWDLFA